MPRKFRNPKPRRADDGQELTRPMLDILLYGWADSPIAGYTEDDNVFGIFFVTDAQWQSLWLEHRDLILAEWKRRGGKGFTFAEQQFEGAPGPYCKPTKGSIQ